MAWLEDHRRGNRQAVFVEDEWRVGPRTIVNAGLRYDRNSEIGARFSPRIALIQTLTPADTLKLIYGTAFRAPNAYEQHYAMSTPGGQEADPDLRPEDIHTQELIREHRPDAYGKVSLSLFHYQMHGLIRQALDTSTRGAHWSTRRSGCSRPAPAEDRPQLRPAAAAAGRDHRPGHHFAGTGLRPERAGRRRRRPGPARVAACGRLRLRAGLLAGQADARRRHPGALCRGQRFVRRGMNDGFTSLPQT